MNAPDLVMATVRDPSGDVEAEPVLVETDEAGGLHLELDDGTQVSFQAAEIRSIVNREARAEARRRQGARRRSGSRR